MSAHRFRFFVDGAVCVGNAVELSSDDVQHLSVLRLRSGELIDVVDSDGAVWEAAISESREVIPQEMIGNSREKRVKLVVLAGVLSGQKWDELVDSVVQAGADEIVPVCFAKRDAESAARRKHRSERVVVAAAKQAKRRAIPSLEVAAHIDEIVSSPGIVLDPGSDVTLDEVLSTCTDGTDVRLLIGPSNGIDADVLDALTQGGWRRARLTDTVMRSELAAAVAVAMARSRVVSL